MADTKVSDLTEIDAVADADLFYIVDDPAGTPAGKNVPASKIATYITDTLGLDTMSQASTSDYFTISQSDAAYQPISANLTTWAGVTPSANGQSLVAAANYAAMRGLLDLEAGTDFLAYSAFSANGISLVGAANYAAMRTLLDLEAGTDFYSIGAADTLLADKVTGPASVTDARFALFDGTTGKLIKQHTGGPGALAVLNTVGTSQIDDDAVDFSKLLNATSAGFVGATASGAYSHRTPTQVTAALDAMVGDSGSGGTKGLVPAPAAGDAAASKFLKADGTWAAPSGGGSISDTAYDQSTWNGDTTGGASRHALSVKFETYIQPPDVATRWYALNHHVTGIANGTAFAANRIYFVPFRLFRKRTFSDLGAVVSTSISGNLALAIYASDATTGKPTGNALAATGDISTASTGAVSADITGADVTLQPGLYWAAFWASAASGVMASPQATLPLVSKLIGSTTQGNILAVTPRGLDCVYYDLTYNSGSWPDMTSNSTTENTTGFREYILEGKAV